MINWILNLFKHKHEWKYLIPGGNGVAGWMLEGEHEDQDKWTNRVCTSCQYEQSRGGYEGDIWGEDALKAIKKLESARRPSGSIPMYWDGDKVVEVLLKDGQFPGKVI